MNFDPLNSRIDFVKHRKKFFAFSGIFLMVGLVLLMTIGMNLGIDFRSGTTVEVLADDTLTAEEVEEQFASIGFEPDDITLAGDDHEIAHVAFIGDLSQDETLMIQDHFEDTYGHTPTISTVTPLVAEELAQNAIIAVAIAAVGIIIYVSIRFEFLSGVSAIIALLHDTLWILTIFTVLQIEVNITFIAAVLTIVGYSINDTIVTFDRIRENMQLEKKVKTKEDVARVVNKSLVQTLARSINTVLTVVFAAGALFIFGGEAIRSFSFALVVGLVAGTYSSLFIAAQIWLGFKGRQIERRRFDGDKQEVEDPQPEG
ncbi:protein translocase subunit SecF [Texcoconibacillus texcoconensis]|uniref:Protein-export membrane protein SecF n=1 Tax=Texcoconibacillus texcoconensis TaxID=1095777 RepID=A0A840QP81_9BACI|nr:preprotein translocase subunit SecF/SecD/SecF fusion protein [Texcoconibacillus texcoconensis]